jgi:hypothetical protein
VPQPQANTHTTNGRRLQLLGRVRCPRVAPQSETTAEPRPPHLKSQIFDLKSRPPHRKAAKADKRRMDLDFGSARRFGLPRLRVGAFCSGDMSPRYEAQTCLPAIVKRWRVCALPKLSPAKRANASKCGRMAIVVGRAYSRAVLQPLYCSRKNFPAAKRAEASASGRKRTNRQNPGGARCPHRAAATVAADVRGPTAPPKFPRLTAASPP